jgi:hypothetical protein
VIGFDYFRNNLRGFRPKTPATALRAFETQILPIEAFLNQGTSAKPLDEEPFDLDEIERVLAREDLDLQTNLLLKGIFERMVKSEDAETALFAAESINLLENRYNKRIEALKKQLFGHQEDEKTLSDLANAYYEFAQLYEEVGTIKSFYLKESFSYLKIISKQQNLDRKNIELIVKVLVQLALYEQALSVLKRYGEESVPLFLLLEAEIEFNRRNFDRVFALCRRLLQHRDQLTEDQSLVIQYWLNDL